MLGQPSGHDVLGNPSAHVSCAAVNLAGVFSRESAPTMPPYAAVGVGDNLTACQTAIGLWATCNEASGGVDMELSRG